MLVDVAYTKDNGISFEHIMGCILHLKGTV